MKRINTTPALDDLWREWMTSVPDKLRGEDGIKAQFGAAAAIVMFLSTERKGAGWTFEPTAVGGWEDRISIDGYLVSLADGTRYAVDFSLEGALNPRGNKRNNPWLVHLRREWFVVREDGVWVLRKECLNALIRAFTPALAHGPVSLLRDPKGGRA